MYRGVGLTVPHSFISTMLYVYVYESLMRKMSLAVDSLTTFKEAKLVFPFFISGVAEFVCLFFDLPFDTVRIRIQVPIE